MNAVYIIGIFALSAALIGVFMRCLSEIEFWRRRYETEEQDAYALCAAAEEALEEASDLRGELMNALDAKRDLENRIHNYKQRCEGYTKTLKLETGPIVASGKASRAHDVLIDFASMRNVWLDID